MNVQFNILCNDYCFISSLLFSWSLYIICTCWLNRETEWENIFLEAMMCRPIAAMCGCQEQLFSCPAWTNSGNKHFFVWLLLWLFLSFYFWRGCMTFSGPTHTIAPMGIFFSMHAMCNMHAIIQILTMTMWPSTTNYMTVCSFVKFTLICYIQLHIILCQG